MEPDAPTPTFFEFTAPVRVEGESDAQTIFTWMVANRYLWMLEGGWADRVEDLVGTARLIGLAGRRMRFRRKSPEHEALRLPAEESARVYAYQRLARFLQMHFVLDDVVNASRETPARLPLMSTRGYPASDFEQLAADISVDHPMVIKNYRAAHEIAFRQGKEQAGTEDLRQAMIHYRTLFAELASQQIAA